MDPDEVNSMIRLCHDDPECWITDERAVANGSVLRDRSSLHELTQVRWMYVDPPGRLRYEYLACDQRFDLWLCLGKETDAEKVTYPLLAHCLTHLLVFCQRYTITVLTLEPLPLGIDCPYWRSLLSTCFAGVTMHIRIAILPAALETSTVDSEAHEHKKKQEEKQASNPNR